MFRVLTALVALQLSIVGAIAQSQQPANMTTTPATPIPSMKGEQLRVLDPTGKWRPTGSLFPTQNSFMSQGTGTLDVTSFGMAPGGQDNSPFVQALMTAAATPAFFLPGPKTVFPPVPGHTAYYYFSEPFTISSQMTIDCNDVGVANGTVVLLFAPGVDGFIQEAGQLTFNGGYGVSDIRGCTFLSLGSGSGNSATGSTTIDNIYLDNYTPVDHDFIWPTDCNPGGAWGQCFFGAGDGIIVMDLFRAVNYGLATATGAYVATANPPTQTVTLASPFVVGTLNGAGVEVWDLPLKQRYTITTSGTDTGAGSTLITVLSGPRFLRPGDKIWTDAWPFGSTIIDTINSLLGTPTVAAGGSGYVGASGTMTYSGPCGYTHGPVLNVTASGGRITGVTSVADVGNCATTNPSSPSTAWTPGGGLSGGNNDASFNTVYQQSANVTDISMYRYVNASKTHTSGSPGYLWTVPTAIVRRTQGFAENNAITYWGFGIDGVCMSGAFPSLGCNSSVDQRNEFGENLVGRMMRGNNAGVSTSTQNVFAHEHIVDEAELGTVGSVYFNEEYNSAENQTVWNDLLVVCGTVNYSSFYGGYYSGQVFGPCIGGDVNGNPSIVVQPSNDPLASSETFILGTYGNPWPSIGPEATLNGPWQVNGPGWIEIAANADAPAGSTLIATNTQSNLRPGLGITDITNSVIPDNTTITSIVYGAVYISNPVTGGGVKLNDTLQFFGGTGCMQLVAGLPDSGPSGLVMDPSCQFSGGTQHGLLFNYGSGLLDLPGGTANVAIMTLQLTHIANLAQCAYGGGNYQSVDDGLAVGATGGAYGDVASATGSTTRAVFCDGNNWVYH